MKSVYDWREKNLDGEPWSPTFSERWHRLDLKKHGFSGKKRVVTGGCMRRRGRFYARAGVRDLVLIIFQQRLTMTWVFSRRWRCVAMFTR